ncbi:hypothetical protein LMG9673_04815 [Ralstonia pseudosolanacearum]|nr:hypothetical protein LMG9673_04815 [Ralstonia pseudosolanacearum]
MNASLMALMALAVMFRFTALMNPPGCTCVPLTSSQPPSILYAEVPTFTTFGRASIVPAWTLSASSAVICPLLRSVPSTFTLTLVPAITPPAGCVIASA